MAVEYRSITEPMRSANPCVTYHEASITSIDADRKVVRLLSWSWWVDNLTCHVGRQTIRCKSVFEGFDSEFDLSYDYLVLGLGMKINT